MSGPYLSLRFIGFGLLGIVFAAATIWMQKPFRRIGRDDVQVDPAQADPDDELVWLRGMYSGLTLLGAVLCFLAATGRI